MLGARCLPGEQRADQQHSSVQDCWARATDPQPGRPHFSMTPIIIDHLFPEFFN